MRYNIRLHSVALASLSLVLFLILFSSTVLAATITETYISQGLNPDIYGDKIIWQDEKNSGMFDGYAIYMYDLSTHQKSQIPENKLYPIQFYPAIYDSKIVWENHTNNNICLYDLSTSQETQISTSGKASKPAIYEEKTVWQDARNGMSNIYMYDLSTSQETQISISGYASNPAIYNDKIIWEDNRNGKNIYMYDLSTSQETQISHSGLASVPSIYEDKIVWQDTRNGMTNIYMYDLSTSQETQISTSGKASTPDIYGDRIVWQCKGPFGIDNPPVFGMYSISTSKETIIATSRESFNFAIYGDKIVWQYNGGPGNIYMWIVSEELPVANFTCNVTEGYAPLSVEFTDLSSNAIGWNWYFGDGATSTEQNPTHTYYAARTYTVTLTASDNNGAKDSKTATINVLKSTPTIVWNTPADITSGTILSSSQLNALASVPGAFTYNPPAGTVLSVGTHKLHADFIPMDTSNYTTASKDVTINVLPVAKKTPILTWNNPKSITSGTALSTTQLNAVASVPGTFVYTPTEGTVLSVGTYTLRVDFTPTDAANYSNVSKEVTINVLEKPVAPVANFSASPTTGKAPLAITFIDSSTGSPTSWYWNFGDNGISTAQNPVHTYSTKGKYTVSLTVENAAGSNTKTISKYITVENGSKKK